VRLLLELLVQGLISGAVYALIAVGLAMVYGLLRILHVAHAALFTLGGYLALLLTRATGSFALGLFLAMLLTGVAGALVYRLVYRPMLDKPPFVALIASIGLFIALEEVYRLVFGPYGLTYATVPLQGVTVLAGASLKASEIGVVIAAVVLLSGLALFATRTRTGIAWRATVSEPAMAASFGVDLAQVRYLNFFVGSAFAAAAGAMVGVLNNLVEPTMGGVPSYKALAIIVLGGLGDVRGTLLAALALGVVEAFGGIYLSRVLDRDSIAFAFLIVVLLARPQGLFGRK
jgi:branched-chain amino acid transport system permease protein